MDGCRTCQAETGEVSLTNAPRLVETTHWRIERVHPCSIPGWMVVVLRRHAAAIHELSETEWTDLTTLLRALSLAMREVLAAEKEYVIQFAEAAGHAHVHFHVVARTADWPVSQTGPRVFDALRDGEPVSTEDATALVEALRPVVEREIAGT